MQNKKAPASRAVEDYLPAIYKLNTEAQGASTTALARAMSVSPASATNMIKKLAVLKLVRHVPYRGAVLTARGRRTALTIVRRHRLIEMFLAEVLGMGWDEVHVEAHRLEHALSERLEDEIARYLGDPAEDPHGDPIPTRAGQVPVDASESLVELEPGMSAIIRRITGQESVHLRYLKELGVVPKATIQLLALAPFEGPVRVRVGDSEQSLSRQLAQHIRVSRRPMQPTAPEELG